MEARNDSRRRKRRAHPVAAAFRSGPIGIDRRLLSGDASRLFWMKITVALTLPIGLLLSAPLWIGPRTYPRALVFDLLPAIPLFDRILLAALLGAAAMILVSPKPQKFIAIFLGAVGILCLEDQTRWQPWVYQYSFLLAALALFSWNGDDADSRTRTLNIARLIVAGTYLFSGLQKINPNFMRSDFPWVMQPLTDVFPDATYPLQWLGIAVPFIQVGFALGLLTTRFRRLSLCLAVAMHVLILAMFGPFGHNWNSVIWPWTAAMAVLDVLLFAGNETFSLRDLVSTKGHAYHAAALALFGVLPALSFFNCWDSYLSSALYSGMQATPDGPHCLRRSRAIWCIRRPTPTS
jgi:hypothetical protein